ncbi:MAG: DegT/DnrJ/EryC1/StrS family aminotransferase [Chitinophagaceae bacterium]|nr:MAG: DegT/DnrJ/EryC1/StrS family aminotransferase [Chitinophagaceae bacterium]
MNTIPVNTPLFSGNELVYLTDCIKTGWISSEGPYVSQFESRLSAYVDRKYGIAVSSGSAALDIALQAIGIERGDEVIMPAFTIISPAFSVIRAGGVPVLVDSDPISWNMDVRCIEQKITSKTKAIIVVHIYGMPVDMDPVIEIAKAHKLKIIEDAAEMHGQTYKERKCGSFGDISVFSFYPNKLITTGEGGMLLTDDESLANASRKLRNLAFEPDGPRFIHNEMGWNYRMTNLQAAIGVAQLEKINEHLDKKKHLGCYYQRKLKSLKGFQRPLEKCSYAENVYWVYGLVAESQTLANQVIKKLDESGISTRPFFWSMHEQPVFQKMGLFHNERYPVSEKLSRNGFYIPSGLGLTKIEQDKIIKVLKSTNGQA